MSTACTLLTGATVTVERPRPLSYAEVHQLILDRHATPARIRKHLAFCVGYREQVALDRANFCADDGQWAIGKLKQHQRSLADIRVAGSKIGLDIQAGGSKAKGSLS